MDPKPIVPHAVTDTVDATRGRGERRARPQPRRRPRVEAPEEDEESLLTPEPAPGRLDIFA